MTIIDIEGPATPPAQVTDDGGGATVRPPSPPVADPRWRRLVADLDRPMSLEWGIALVVAWVVVMIVGVAVEPAPANPDAPVPLAVDLLALAQLSLWAVMAVGLFQRRRYTAAASLAGAGVLAVMAIACPASGHHAVGAWWGVQMVGVSALLFVSGKALRSSRA
jgi:hypothetical protein